MQGIDLLLAQHRMGSRMAELANELDDAHR